LKVISNTLGAFWKNEETEEQIDDSLLALLGTGTPVKCWPAVYQSNMKQVLDSLSQ